MDRLNAFPNERVGLPDFEDGPAGRLTQNDQMREKRVLTLPTTTGSRIFSGFDWATPPDTNSGVGILNRGTGIFPFRKDDGTVDFGLVFGDEGESTKTIDFTILPVLTVSPFLYTVWVRAITEAGDTENRVFWNPSGSPAQEFVDSVPTRLLVRWEYKVQSSLSSPPGEEWVRLWDIEKDAGLTYAETDKRVFFYEGDAGSSYAQEWGDAPNDRNSDRSAYGVGDEHTWTQLVRRQLTDIIGEKHYSAPLTSLLDVHKINNLVYTVNTPGGDGKDGHYATLTAAINDLNLANGGIIALRSGTYSVPSAVTLSKSIVIMGIEEGVTIQNDLATGTMLTFIAERGGLDNVTITKNAASESAIEVQADRVRVTRCSITGLTTINGSRNGVVIESSKLRPSDSLGTIKLIGTTPSLSIKNCDVSSDGTLTSAFITISATSTGSRTGILSFTDCDLQFGINGTLTANSPGVSVKFNKCRIGADPPAIDATFTCNGTFDGTLGFNNCEIDLTSAPGDDYLHPIMDIATGSLLLDSCKIANSSDPLASTYSFLALSIIRVSEKCNIVNNEFTDFVMPQNTTSLGALIAINFAEAVISNNKFLNISNVATGTINTSIISANISGTAVTIANNLFDGASSVYATTTSSMISASSNAGRLIIEGNTFIGGTWENVLELVTGVVTGNQFWFKNGNLANAIKMTGSQTSIDEHSVASLSNNTIHCNGTTASSIIELNSLDRLSVMGNVITNLGSAPANKDIHLNNTDIAGFIGNITTYGWTKAGTTVTAPADGVSTGNTTTGDVNI